MPMTRLSFVTRAPGNRVFLPMSMIMNMMMSIVSVSFVKRARENRLLLPTPAYGALSVMKTARE